MFYEKLPIVKYFLTEDADGLFKFTSKIMLHVSPGWCWTFVLCTVGVMSGQFMYNSQVCCTTRNRQKAHGTHMTTIMAQSFEKRSVTRVRVRFIVEVFSKIFLRNETCITESTTDRSRTCCLGAGFTFSELGRGTSRGGVTLRRLR